MSNLEGIAELGAELLRVTEENARLRAELAHQTEMADVAHQTAVQMREEAERLRAEVAALKLQLGVGGQGDVVAASAAAMTVLKRQRDQAIDALQECRKEISDEVGWTWRNKELRDRIDAALGKEVQP